MTIKFDDRDIINVKNLEHIKNEISMLRLGCLQFQEILTYSKYKELERKIDNLEKSIIKILE